MKSTSRLGLLAITLASSVVALADAPPPEGGTAPSDTPPQSAAKPSDAPRPPGGTAAAEAQAEIRVVFTEEDKAVIKEFFRPYHEALPADYAKKHTLPPGHAWRLKLNRRVTDGAPWRNLHSDLERKLSRLPKGYFRIAIGTDIGIVQPKTRIVVDLLENVTP